ncbi:Transportin-1 [Rhizophlyctis rosea]|uniref:Transportin-1 n=1 Tax=Rhizophlyctis rosea TaxID=64517 RepID=A0AAD5SN93_9FUNG|nr:Transportin-1 [Rhizophlyctis rosea]
MEWQPETQNSEQLLQILRAATSLDNQLQHRAYQQLNSFNKLGDYNNYLAYILAHPQLPAQTRAMGGMVLKANLNSYLEQIDGSIVQYVKNKALQTLGDSEVAVRTAAGSILTTIVSKDVHKYPDVLQTLMQMIDKPETVVVEGAFSALEKICEDSTTQLDRDPSQPLNFMIPKFLHFFNHDSPKVRAAAIHCVHQFATATSAAVQANIDAYVQALYRCTNDSSTEVRKYVCQALVCVLEIRPEALMDQLDNVVSFMLYCTDSADESVALEACEFWLAFAEQPFLRDHLEPYLARIVPVLIKGMVYTPDDIIELTGMEDTTVPDKEEDLKPRHHKAQTHSQKHDAPAAPTGAATNGAHDDDDDDSDFDEDDDEEDTYSKWSLRKCSAAALDVIATVFGDELLLHLLPKLKEELFHQDWEHRECGILALGAIAEGCPTGMYPHLPQLIPHLIQTLKDPQPLVRAITCWTLSRYVRWVVYPGPIPAPMNEAELAHHRRTYFNPLLEGLLSTIQDNNKRVQEAGCSALASVEEEAVDQLVPFLGPILQHLTHAFSKYQRKNLLILYDAVGTLAEAVGPELNKAEHIELLMPPLIKKWNELPDDSKDIFPLLECMSSVATALGPGFMPFAPNVWDRCLRLVSHTLQQLTAYQQHPDQLDEPDKDFMVVALDLMSGMAQGLNTAVEPLVVNSQPNVLSLLMICIKDPTPEVRQSAYALLGDLAISAFEHVRPHLNVFLPDLISQIDDKPASVGVSVTNNATWAVGEIALKYEGEIAPWVDNLLPRLITLLQNGGGTASATLKENAAITIGRLGGVVPDKVAPHLEIFIQPWCETLRDIRDNLEKESAFRGLVKMVEVKPTGVAQHFGYFCDAIVRWKRISPELNEMFRNVLTYFKNGWGQQWPGVMAKLPPQVQEELRRRYAL